MYQRRSFEEFRETGLLWFINQTLHVFGWAIAIDDKEMYPMRVSFRGFSEKNNAKGYEKIAKYMRDNSEQIYKETKGE